MTHQAIIKKTVQAIIQLPEDKAAEISIFAELVMKQYEEQKLTQGIQKMATIIAAFNSLNGEEDLYFESDLKDRSKNKKSKLSGRYCK